MLSDSLFSTIVMSYARKGRKRGEKSAMQSQRWKLRLESPSSLCMGLGCIVGCRRRDVKMGSFSSTVHPVSIREVA